MYSYIFLQFLTPNQPFVTRAPNRYRPCSPPSWRDQRRHVAHLEVPGYTRGTRFWGILLLFRGWITENYGKTYGKTYGNILCKNVHVLYTANELVCLVSGCPSTHHCRRTPTGSVRRTAAVQTNKCKWTTSKHIEENTKIIQKLSELLSREETKHELSSTLLLFGLTEEHFHGISWLPSAVLLKIIPARDPKQCKNEMQSNDMHSIRQSHITFHHITTTTTRTICRFGKLCGPKVSLPRTWLFLTCFWPLYVSSMCEHSMCEHPLCEHSMCEHSMWALYVWPL